MNLKFTLQPEEDSTVGIRLNMDTKRGLIGGLSKDVNFIITVLTDEFGFTDDDFKPMHASPGRVRFEFETTVSKFNEVLNDLAERGVVCTSVKSFDRLFW